MCTLTHTIKTNARRICPIIILIFKLLKYSSAYLRFIYSPTYLPD